MLLHLLLPTVQAATLTVPGDYATIVEAVSASNDGDEILISAGTYNEQVDIPKPLTLAGAGGAVVITSVGTVIVIGNDAVTLRDLTVQSMEDRGISANGTDLVLERVTVQGGQGDRSGAGLYQFSGTLTVRDSTFTNNDAGSASGGHIATSSAQVTVLDSTFTGGTAQKGGAIFLSNSTAEISGCTFDGNSAVAFDQDGRGGAVRDEGGTLTIRDSIFTDNRAEGGFGGAVSLNGSSYIIDSCEMSDNAAIEQFGGAVAAWNSDGSISGSRFSGNTTSDDTGTGIADGGAVASLGDTSGSLALSTSTFTTNDAANDGGGLYVALGEIHIDDCTFETNYAASGAAVYISSSSVATVYSSTFSGNLGGSGGALRWRPSGTAASMDLERCTFADNTSTGYGGGLYAYGGDGIRVYGNRFLGNEAVVGGGMMAFGTTDVQVIGNVFCDNIASGDPQSHGGGAISYQAGADSHSYTNNVFAQNSAEVQGGGLMVWQGGPVDILNNDFLENVAGSEGPGVYFRDNDGQLTNNLLAENGVGSAVESRSDPDVVLDYNDFYQNDDDLDDYLSPLHGSHLRTDPPDFAEDVSDCRSASWMLSAGSALIDAGDPSITDIDGSRSDIGATGGPDGDAQILTDSDGDGFFVNGSGELDCDDDDANTYPGAPETPYDGQDQDCDGADLRDVDNDGVEGEAVGGADCDDQDPTVYPTAPDTWYDGVDSDCDGADDFDRDLDGYPGGDDGDDCDDDDPEVHPGAIDIDGDDIDTDCDGADGLAPADTGDGSHRDEKDCGCSSAASPTPALGLLALLALARRRARA